MSGSGVSSITCVSSSVYDVIMEWVIMQDSNSITSYVLETRTSVWEMEIEIFMKEVKLKLCSPEIELEISVGAREVFYYISYLSLLKSPWNNDQCSDNEHSYCPDDDIKIPFPTKRNQGFLKKWLIPGLWQEMYKSGLFCQSKQPGSYQRLQGYIKRLRSQFEGGSQCCKMEQFEF